MPPQTLKLPARVDDLICADPPTARLRDRHPVPSRRTFPQHPAPWSDPAPCPSQNLRSTASVQVYARQVGTHVRLAAIKQRRVVDWAGRAAGLNLAPNWAQAGPKLGLSCASPPGESCPASPVHA